MVSVKREVPCVTTPRNTQNAERCVHEFLVNLSKISKIAKICIAYVKHIVFMTLLHPKNDL